MINTCIDVVFGQMTYKHRWFKQQNICLFGKKWNIMVSAMAYSGEPITEEERLAYKQFMDHVLDNTTLIEKEIKMYINNNLEKLSEYWLDAKSIENFSDLVSIVTPRSLVFKQDGTTLIMLDCVWDEEHGIAVKIYPTIEVGPQYCFL